MLRNDNAWPARCSRHFPRARKSAHGIAASARSPAGMSGSDRRWRGCVRNVGALSAREQIGGHELQVPPSRSGSPLSVLIGYANGASGSRPAPVGLADPLHQRRLGRRRAERGQAEPALRGRGGLSPPCALARTARGSTYRLTLAFPEHRGAAGLPAPTAWRVPRVRPPSPSSKHRRVGVVRWVIP